MKEVSLQATGALFKVQIKHTFWEFEHVHLLFAWGNTWIHLHTTLHPQASHVVMCFWMLTYAYRLFTGRCVPFCSTSASMHSGTFNQKRLRDLRHSRVYWRRMLKIHVEKWDRVYGVHTACFITPSGIMGSMGQSGLFMFVLCPNNSLELCLYLTQF